MKKYIFIIFFLLNFESQKKDFSTNKLEGQYSFHKKNYMQDMRNFVQNISNYAKIFNPNFIIIPQNGCEIITENGEPDGEVVERYINSIDGIGREDLFYGYTGDDIPTPDVERNFMLPFLEISKQKGKKILVIDYCSTHSYVDDSYNQNYKYGFISFAADHRELDNIPPYPNHPYNVNLENIKGLNDAKNFLYLINPGLFFKKDDFLNTLMDTDFDILIIDLFFGKELLAFEEVKSLKTKKNGGTRLVISYMSIGEAEDYRYYWKDEWNYKLPYWIVEENPEWEGNYTVKYWMYEWQSIIFGNNNSYLKKIIDSGFDGVYLDKIDVFEYFLSK